MTYLISPVINGKEMKGKRIIGKRKTYKFLENILEQNDLQVENVIKREKTKEFVCSQYGSRVFVKRLG